MSLGAQWMPKIWSKDEAARDQIWKELFDWVVEERKKFKEAHGKLPNCPDYYKGKHVFVTGGSGFLGRSFVEELLRRCPDVGAVYLLLRAKKGVEPTDRLNDITNVALFDRLKKEQPHALDKLVVVSGDCSELGLGISEEDRRMLVENVSIVIHSAASVRFDDPVKKAVLLNLRGTREMVELCKEMKNIKALIHISTAFAFTDHNPTEERVYPTPLDWRTVIRAAEKCDSSHLDNLGPLLLGLQPNTYTWTKALAEQIVDEVSEIVPVAIFRPSIVVSSVFEPFPGWNDNLNGPGAILLGVMTGVLRVFPSSENRRDAVSVDGCSKSILLLAWQIAHGIRTNDDRKETEVVNLSGAPADFRSLNATVQSCVQSKEFYPNSVRYPYTYVTSNRFVYAILFFIYHIVFGLVVDTILRLAGMKPRLMAAYRRMTIALNALEPFDRELYFHCENMWHGLTFLHPDDYDILPIADMNWARENVDNLMKQYVKGMSLYLLRNTEEQHKTAARHNYLLLAADVVFHLAVGILFYRWLMS